MNPRVLLPCLLVLAIALSTAAEENNAHDAIALGGVPMRLGIAREAVFAALKIDKRYLITKLPDERWVVSDRVEKRAVAILTFDRGGRLRRVQKNWTPQADSGLALAGTLFEVVEQLQSAGGSASCTLTASKQLVNGPNTPMRDPGNPDLKVRRIELSCGRKEIEIYIEEPTEASMAVTDKFLIPAVLLYESIGRQPEASKINASTMSASTVARKAAPRAQDPE